MNSVVEILACPLCKLGLDEMQARAMEYSIYFMLALIYSLAGVIGFKVYRMMAREERDLALRQPAAKPAAPAAPEASKAPEEPVSTR
ncbi:MAG TPA: hypothetical protein VM222_00320 [Planctomycetota bacterium]|nr:hypothetical protein [Planctomycetota bacterium]